ncbi:uncharacterized protein LOC133300905 [Gastrolobium bilobum]|uniref:uncharacterized protein LOC133300905 n=1 Tax=Gastrolobium bilobum TaxID=150636 RepID=UPI002AB0858B|nr:uncharacterized protein LOC133300905 [Gastrolobium bilobum]
MRDMNQRIDTLENQLQAAEVVREQQYLQLQESQTKMQESQTQQFNILRQELNRLVESHIGNNGSGVLGAGPHRTHTATSGQHHPQPMKITFPRFSDGDPTDWIFSATRYFDYYHIPDNERVLLASFNLDKLASSWFHGLFNDGLLPNWPALFTAMQRRFGPSEFEDPAVSLANLRQQTTVSDFQANFEIIASRTPGLSPTLKRALFIAGLKPHIRRPVLVQRPQDVHSAFSLAKIYEDQQADTHSGPRQQRPWLPRPSITNNNNSNTFSPNKNTTSSPSVPIKRLTVEEIQNKRDKGLCFGCDERYVFGHKCKGKATLLYFEGTDDDNAQPMEEDTPVIPPDADPLPNSFSEISLNALFGHYSPRSFRLTGSIHGKQVQILVDGASTHNFITHKMATYLGLVLQTVPPFTVQVGNGDGLTCKALCCDIPLMLQSHRFFLDLYVLDLQGADIVLGVQWLATLGPILTDYGKLLMSFEHHGNTIQLQGQRPDTSLMISPAKLNKLIASNAYTSCLMCFTQSAHTSTITTPSHTDPIPHTVHEIQQLLANYSDVFTIPTTLPPNRSHNHHITLLPNSKAVQVRPYRYPHFRKNEIEKLCQEMLQSGIIRPSQSPFSSPVLLVKKKDDT